MDILLYRKNKAYTLLLVEDDEILGNIYVDALTSAGYRVLKAKDGKAALHIFSNNTIHGVLLDLMLPKISGIQVLEHISQSTVPVIIITNAYNDELMRECLAKGVCHYIIKSDYTPAQIVSIVGKHISSEGHGAESN